MDDTNHAVKNLLIKEITTRPYRSTALALERELSENLGVNRDEIKTALRDLIRDGCLAYVNLFEQTYVERGHCRPMRLSRHVTVQPPEITHPADAGEIVIYIASGAAFGNGQHPSTRLAVRGIDLRIQFTCIWSGTDSGWEGRAFQKPA